MRKIGDLIGEAFQNKEVMKAEKDQQVLWRWPAVVGEFLASKTVPDRFEHGTLWVAASGSAWAQEVRLQQVEILERLNTFAGERLFELLRVGSRPPRRTWEPGAELN